MNRRGFLGALAAALALDPERGLWVPGKKLISIPAPPVYRACFNSRWFTPSALFAVGDLLQIGGRKYRVLRIDDYGVGPVAPVRMRPMGDVMVELVL